MKQRKEEIAEDWCFVCKDGGTFRVCDYKDCLKVYHPECVGKDDSFLEAKDRWICDWHLCSVCNKASKFQCFCCTKSMCGLCVNAPEFVLIKGTKGFCNNCLKLVKLIEEKEEVDSDGEQVNFRDQDTIEYLFMDYWVTLNEREKLTLNIIQSAYAHMKKGKNFIMESELDEVHAIEEEDEALVSDYDDGGDEWEQRKRVKRQDLEGISLDANDENLLEDFKWERNSTPKRKSLKKEVPLDTQQASFASIVEQNIKLVYLRRSLVEKLLKEPESFEAKVVGSYVRVKSDPNNYLQKTSHQLLQVTGIKKSSGIIKMDILLQISNWPNDIPFSMLSDEYFTEEECADLRRKVKDGLHKNPTIVEFEQKVRTLHKDITQHWIERELEILQNGIDQSTEKGWRRQLSEWSEPILEEMNLKGTSEIPNKSLQDNGTCCILRGRMDVAGDGDVTSVNFASKRFSLARNGDDKAEAINGNIPEKTRRGLDASHKEKTTFHSFSKSSYDSEEDDAMPKRVSCQATSMPAKTGATRSILSYHRLKFVLSKDSKAIPDAKELPEEALPNSDSSKRTLQSSDAIKESKKASSLAPIPSASKSQYLWEPMTELNKKQKTVDSPWCAPVDFPESPTKTIHQDVFVPTFPAAKASPQLFDPRAVLARLKSLPNPASDSEVVHNAKKTLSFFKTIDLSSAFSCQKELKQAITTLLAEEKKNPDGSSYLISLQEQFHKLTASFDMARCDLLETNDLLAKKEHVKHRQQDFKQTYCANLEDSSSQCGRIIAMFEQEKAKLEEKLNEVQTKLFEARDMQASIRRDLRLAEKGMLECGEEESWLARKVEAERQINATEIEWEKMKELITGDFSPFEHS